MKTTWLELYNFLYHKAHDFKNLGNFDWNLPIKVIDADSGKEYTVEHTLQKGSNAELFCNPSLIIKLDN